MAAYSKTRYVFYLMNFIVLAACVLAGLLSIWWLYPVGIILWIAVVSVINRRSPEDL
jgi:hypothetical protein